jgi:hypothetical protein
MQSERRFRLAPDAPRRRILLALGDYDQQPRYAGYGPRPHSSGGHTRANGLG